MPRDGSPNPCPRNPFLGPGELTLADVLARIEADQSADPTRRRDLASAVRRFCVLTDRVPAMLPARMPKLRTALDALTPGKTGLSDKTLSNTRSNLLAALRAHGGCQSLNAVRGHLTPDWAALAKTMASQRLSTGLSRLIRFCSGSGIAPAQVDDGVVARFMAAVESSTFVRDLKGLRRQTTRLWNEAADTIPGWPQRRVAVPDQRQPRWTVPLADFPGPFQEDLARYFIWRQDPLADDPAPRLWRDISIASERSRIEGAASALVRSGRPIASITRLADLVDEPAAKTIAQFYWKRAGEKPSMQAGAILTCLISIARYWTKSPGATVENLKQLRRRIRLTHKGMTPKNRATLRRLELDPELEARLLHLPGTLFEEALHQPFTVKAAVKAQVALAIELLLMVPIRMRALIGLEFGKHLIEPADRSAMILALEAGDTKTDDPVEYPLPEHLVRMLGAYRRRFHPLFAPDGSASLFPSNRKRQKTQSCLAQQIVRAIERRVGLHMTPHQFRHFAGEMAERAGLGMTVAQRVLGHKSSKTTERFYSRPRTAAAARQFDGMVIAKREQLRPPAKRRRARNRSN